MNATIAPTGVVYRILLRELLSVGRFAVIGALALTALASGIAIGLNDGTPERAANLMENFGLVVVLPVVALLFAGAIVLGWFAQLVL